MAALAGSCALLALATSLPAQERTVAIINARVLPIEDKPIDKATVLLRDGVIMDIGAEVEVPAGAEVVDADGGTLMPGLVSAYSRAGLVAARRSSPQLPPQFRRSRRQRGARSSSSSSATNQASKKVTAGLYARQDVFGELLQCGVTTLALTPAGNGFPGQGAVIDPAGNTLEDLTIDDEAFVLVQPADGTKTKKLLKDSLEKAKKVVEERKKPKPAPKPTEPEKKPAETKEGDKAKKKGDRKEGDKKETPPEKKPPEKKPPEKKPAEEKSKGAKKPAAKKKPKDPNVEVLADVLEGKRRAFLAITSATDLAHFADAIGDTTFPEHVLIAASQSSNRGRLDEVLDKLEKYKGTILTAPSLTTPPYSRAMINPPARMIAGGFEVGFILPDSKTQLRQLFFQLIELVRYGLDRDAALAAVTLVPAKALGIEDRVGSIAKGRDADLLLFDGDPLDPTSKMVRVWHKGLTVEKERPQ